MALPTLNATFASSADLPRRYMLAQWLVNISYSGSVADYITLPEQYLWAKIAVAAGASRGEADYISLPKQYIWKAIYDAVSGSSNGTIDWGEKQAVGHIAAAYRGDTANPANLATYIDWPWRYQVASVITHTNIDTDAQAFITTTSASDKEGIDQFVKGVKNLGLWSSMVCWPLRSSQNSGGADPTNTTVYSLGGLGTYNGTRVNGTVWDSVGLDFDGSDDRVTLPNGSFGTGNAATSIWAFLKNDTTASQMVVLSQGNNGVNTDAFSLQSRSPSGSDAAVVALTVSNIGLPSTSWKSLFMGNTTAGFRGKDGGTVTQFSLSNVLNKTGNSCAIGSFGNHPTITAPFDGKIAAVIRINATPTTQLNGDIYTLYKNTLGTGLGLP